MAWFIKPYFKAWVKDKTGSTRVNSNTIDNQAFFIFCLGLVWSVFQRYARNQDLPDLPRLPFLAGLPGVLLSSNVVKPWLIFPGSKITNQAN